MSAFSTSIRGDSTLTLVIGGVQCSRRPRVGHVLECRLLGFAGVLRELRFFAGMLLFLVFAVTLRRCPSLKSSFYSHDCRLHDVA